MPKHANSQSKLKTYFVRQVIFISLATITGVMASAWVLEGLLTKRALELEAAYFWNEFSENINHPEPNTKHLEGFYDPESELSEFSDFLFLCARFL